MSYLQIDQWLHISKNGRRGEQEPFLHQLPIPNNQAAATDTLWQKIKALGGRGKALSLSFLDSKFGHFSVLFLVTIDVSCIFGDILIKLYICDLDSPAPGWENTLKALGVASLVFSCLFVVELFISLWALGTSYFRSKFRCFDGFVIVVGFVIDVVLHGIIEEIASLVVILRLWRIFKIIEELSAGAADRVETLERRIEFLESENIRLKEMNYSSAHPNHNS